MHEHARGRPFRSREEFTKFVQNVCPDADITSFLLFGQVHRASHMLEQAAERSLERVGLSWAKFRLLMYLVHCESLDGSGLQPSELSERQDISRNTVSALIGGLEKDGLISREPHGEDRRRYVIRLSAKGRRIVQAQLAGQIQFVSQCFDALRPGEREELLKQLFKLNASLSEKEDPVRE
jgi:DNA-binding MarR family transcriptional regulator